MTMATTTDPRPVESPRRKSIVARGMNAWIDQQSDHGETCPCFMCAETRAYLNKPPLPGMRPPERPL
jgi:hypothetical protein